MADHPLNLALRFFLELAALFAMGYWGWTQHSGLARFIWAVGLPLFTAALWGIFRVPGDPGNAPVAVPGPVRLLLEAAFFGTAVWALAASGRSGWALAFGLVVTIHYILSYDRVVRFLT
jgi:hypothetical protein